MNTCPTNTLQTLVLAADSCEFCEGAIREGINLARLCTSKLFAVSVVEFNAEFDALAPELVEGMSKETKAHLDAVKQRANSAGVECETIAHQGDEAYEYIVKEARERKADTIIMGRRGRRGLKRLFMGSVTAQVIGHAPCNVLVVPRKARVEFKNILIASDGSKSSEAAAREAIGVAKKAGSRLTAVAVQDGEVNDAEAIVKKIKELASSEGVKADGLVLSGRPYEAIVKASEEAGADLVVVGNRGRTALDRLLMGSVAERVIGLSNSAVLVVKP